MTTISTPARPERADTDVALTWRQAADDVFVATRDGEFAGYIAVDRQRHVAHNRHSRRIGAFPTLAAARAALGDGRSRGGRPSRRRA
jgi:hypothetical protein